jgi:hypothetical protein
MSARQERVEMRRLLDHVGRARVRPAALYPLAVIVGSLAYGWYLVLVGIVLPVFAEAVGAD